MNLRLLVSFGAAAIAIAVASCSSGLGNNLPADPTAAPPAAPSANAPVGLDLGVVQFDRAAADANGVVLVVVLRPVPLRLEVVGLLLDGDECWCGSLGDFRVGRFW